MKKEIKVKRDFTNLTEVLFEVGEIVGTSKIDEYMKNHVVTKDNKTLEKKSRLMKGDIISVSLK